MCGKMEVRQSLPERLEALIHDVLLVDLLKYVCPDDCMEVCLHVLKNKIDITVVIGTQNVVQLHYVLMLIHLQKAEPGSFSGEHPDRHLTRKKQTC